MPGYVNMKPTPDIKPNMQNQIIQDAWKTPLKRCYCLLVYDQDQLLATVQQQISMDLTITETAQHKTNALILNSAIAGYVPKLYPHVSVLELLWFLFELQIPIHLIIM